MQGLPLRCVVSFSGGRGVFSMITFITRPVLDKHRWVRTLAAYCEPARNRKPERESQDVAAILGRKWWKICEGIEFPQLVVIRR